MVRTESIDKLDGSILIYITNVHTLRVAEELCRLFAADRSVDMTPILRRSKETARYTFIQHLARLFKQGTSAPIEA